MCCRPRTRLGKTRSVCRPWGAPTRWTSTACSRSTRTPAPPALCRGSSTLWREARSRPRVLVQFWVRGGWLLGTCPCQRSSRYPVYVAQGTVAPRCKSSHDFGSGLGCYWGLGCASAVGGSWFMWLMVQLHLIVKVLMILGQGWVVTCPWHGPRFVALYSCTLL